MAIQPNDIFGTVDMNRPGDAIVLTSDMDVRAVIDRSPAGATFWFEAGTYRLDSPIDPKDGQSFFGEKGATLDGSVPLEGIEADGDYYSVSGQTQQGQRFATENAMSGFERAGYPETVFVDGQPLKAVASLGELEAGAFYFDYAADKIFFAESLEGRQVEAGVSPAAFLSDASNVTVSNFVIEHFNSPVQRGAIQGGEGWTVENNEVRFNYGAGITVQDDGRMLGNFVHNNGQLGLGASGNGILVEGNEIAQNGYWSGIEVDFEAGGSKFGEASNLVVRDNYAHDNSGYGLWTDENSINVLYEGNLVTGNEAGGISHEISYDAVIRDNTLVGNGAARADGWLWGAQVQIQNSRDTEVYGNRIDMSGGVNGIALVQQDRGGGRLGEYVTIGNSVHDNVIVSRSGDGVTGGAADFDEDGMLNGGNTFFDNAYYMNDGDHWRWGDFPSGDDWNAYLEDSGQGNGSTLSNAIPDTASWLTGTASIPVVADPGGSPGSSGSSGTPIVADPQIPDDGPVQLPGISFDGQPTLTGTAGDDDLDGTGGADVIATGAGRDIVFAAEGNDLISGGAGADIFVFEIASGQDRILDFEASGPEHDTVVLPDDYFQTAGDVIASARDVEGDVVIAYGDNVLTLEDLSVAALSDDHFQIM
ncbi:right-handed parallel beta-helix repeat-containing protein [Fulvimarina sp. 2208YS6-2-32]|uniref:Right-handed parallel beta-helix repeat-containing protein n=1 Tax=Fulvimarina uroteuthidis TaxID=3098149 RepID=A0ABU5I084_9HYPH|nr:right-handed parallel beta-helix repeat-containing protein [Fulvimarina sp. 2208YS6-2-32]MDY8108799.1 right-handed parallel beta-helix repeat-containing protein [Fulvimarina sp. 2208YS6-2-32]